MPPRTNPRQAIVFLLRKHMADGRSIVRESEMLKDAATGQLREVDVVVRTSADGDPIVIGMEVTDRKRPADLGWVEQMIKKHDRLPTNRVVLVSWSGFTASASAAVEAEGGRFAAMTPKQIEEGGRPIGESRRLTACAIGWPTNVLFGASDGDGHQRLMAVKLGTPIYSSAGVATCKCADVAWELLQRHGFRDEVDAAIRQHGLDADGAAYSVDRVDLGDDGWHLLWPDSEELLLIESAKVSGTIRVGEVEVEFWLTRLGDREFKVGDSPFHGSPAVWLAIPTSEGSERLVFRDVARAADSCSPGRGTEAEP